MLFTSAHIHSCLNKKFMFKKGLSNSGNSQSMSNVWNWSVDGNLVADVGAEPVIVISCQRFLFLFWKNIKKLCHSCDKKNLLNRKLDVKHKKSFLWSPYWRHLFWPPSMVDISVYIFYTVMLHIHDTAHFCHKSVRTISPQFQQLHKLH